MGRLGYEIIPAVDGPTAIKRLGLILPDLILLDLFMPEMDGVEVCRRLQANSEWRHLPVIFLSAADDKDLVVRALESGGVDFLTKPFNHAELIARVKTQVALKQTRDRLKQVAEDKDELLGILTHDLKGHLGGMQMTAQLLQDRIGGLKDPRVAQLIDNILRSSSQMLNFVEEFLANAEADQCFAFKPQKIQFSAAASQAVHQYREAMRRKQLELRVDLPDGDTGVVADVSALDHVLDNLLSNAVKFSPPGGTISVMVEEEHNHVKCCVRDFGPGFTEEDKARMFRRYGRLSARPTGGEPSTGLGLSIVQKLVKMMSGELVCDSVHGAGASFTVRLPRPTA